MIGFRYDLSEDLVTKAAGHSLASQFFGKANINGCRRSYPSVVKQAGFSRQFRGNIDLSILSRELSHKTEGALTGSDCLCSWPGYPPVINLSVIN